MSTRLQIPPFWEKLLKRYVKKTFYAGTRKADFADRETFTEGDYRFFAKGVQKLNLGFTEERGSLPRNYLNQKDLRSGYLLYFLPVNALKVAALLTQNDCLKEALSLSSRPWTVLDIGSGPGTGMLGTILALERLLQNHPVVKHLPLRFRWILVDLNRQALHDACTLHDEAIRHLREVYPQWEIYSECETIIGDLASFGTRKYGKADLILALNLLGELPRQHRLSLVERLLRHHLHPEGRLLLLEPALQRTTRELMELHDEMVNRNSGRVYAPCLHQARCPMLAANRRDWCHTYLEWERPDWIARLDQLVGIRKDYLKCSYLLLGSRKGADIVSPQTWRVVSGHLNSKGKSELLLCGPGSLPRLKRVNRLDRDRSEVNREFDRVQRGDIVQVFCEERIYSDTSIRTIR